MKSKENIVFLGMMGSGKSSIGSLVSKKLKLNFFDIDSQIENELGMKISKIFETKGEKFFREFEETITLKILKKNKIVISLGGGTFMSKKVRREILTNHMSFWLQWDDKTLVERIKNSIKRPVAIQSSNDELLELIKKRSSIYSKARYKINCNNLTKLEIVEKVMKNL
ncbi:shikimate kinase [Candidatus Pelagibacter sp.]|nr:shikimate kinase [Candidatus Pelagibacter sp.]